MISTPTSGVGRRYGTHGGLDSVMTWLDKLGLPPGNEARPMAILKEVKAARIRSVVTKSACWSTNENS